MLKRVMRPFQRQWIEGFIAHKYSFVLGSRQIGKSYALGWFAIMCALGWDGDHATPPSDVLIISSSLDKAKLIIRAVHAHLDKLERVCGPVRDPQRGGVQDVVFTNGVQIKAVSGRPRALQGFTGHVFVDEYSITEADPEELMAQALAVASSQPHFRVCCLTNADRAGSFVHQFMTAASWEQRREGFFMQNTTIYDAFPAGLPEHISAVKRAASPQAWAKYYENAFLQAGSQRFDEALLRSCFDQPPISQGRVWLSVDPGFSSKGNPTGWCVVRAHGGHIAVLDAGLIYGPTEEELLDRIEHLVDQWNVSGIVVDQGTQFLLTQKLKRRWGGQLHPASINKNGLIKAAANFEEAAHFGRVSLCQSRELFDDLMSIGVKADGSLVVPERGAPRGEYKIHADSAMALLQVVPLCLTKRPAGGRPQIMGSHMSSLHANRFV